MAAFMQLTLGAHGPSPAAIVWQISGAYPRFVVLACLAGKSIHNSQRLQILEMISEGRDKLSYNLISEKILDKNLNL
jgi:hypothetical protein